MGIFWPQPMYAPRLEVVCAFPFGDFLLVTNGGVDLIESDSSTEVGAVLRYNMDIRHAKAEGELHEPRLCYLCSLSCAVLKCRSGSFPSSSLIFLFALSTFAAVPFSAIATYVTLLRACF